MGKGSKKRPSTIPYNEYSEKFEDIFGKKIMWWENKDIELVPKETEAETENEKPTKKSSRTTD